MEYVESEKQKARRARDGARELIFMDIFELLERKYPHVKMKVTMAFEDSQMFTASHGVDLPSESEDGGKA